MATLPPHPHSLVTKAKIMGGLNHANVVSIYGFYKDDPKHYDMALEVMEGGELLDKIVKKVCDVFFVVTHPEWYLRADVHNIRDDNNNDNKRLDTDLYDLVR